MVMRYFTFQDMLEKKFGKQDKPAPEQPGAIDSRITFEMKKMEIGLEQWKIERDEASVNRVRVTLQFVEVGLVVLI